jgi:RNA polymerase sigma-70 factor (ECF subfamily)
MKTREPGGKDDIRFNRVYGSYYRRMVAYFCRVFRVSEADAKDLTQDSFIRFYKAMDEYDGVAEWALLERIAHNVGLNRVRSVTTIKRGSVRTESLDDGDFFKEPADVNRKHPIDTMIETEQLRQMREAIKGLPPGERQSIQLSLEGYSGEEIARILRISVAAVKSRIRDAKRALRERLGDENALPED